LSRPSHPATADLLCTGIDKTIRSPRESHGFVQHSDEHHAAAPPK
jgi:hypothetical protein